MFTPTASIHDLMPQSQPTNPMGNFIQQIGNSPMGQAVQGNFGNVLPALKQEWSDIHTGKYNPQLAIGGEMETVPASFEGIRMPQTGLPKVDINDLDTALDSYKSKPNKDALKVFQDIVERYAPSHAIDTNNQLANTASRIQEAHYGNGSNTMIEKLGHSH